MLRKTHMIATICAAALTTATLSTPAQAADAVKAVEPAQNQTQNAAEKKMDAIIESSDQLQDGAVQSSTGRAKPIENWFGCKPDTDNDDVTECGPEKSENQKPDAAAAAADAHDDTVTAN